MTGDYKSLGLHGFAYGSPLYQQSTAQPLDNAVRLSHKPVAEAAPIAVHYMDQARATH